ncbi:hypothetical protein NF27_HS00180 [Candidatus Jidaibacter acanthamoeba]|uniref:Uncharacterized protein n=1 Tax=Candidatus Jidaibacter acanthamoebae TaxID=86105 RepID=A0A0C1MX04_9RICK|nr:hypothetical protein [Candidatus Jidaibacter acanthamoeba]KIE04431.1 hypothetical protein NF27_HS00180 [Candidatus Jidaibacter acanthamoeba]
MVTGANIIIDGDLTTTKASAIADIINNVGADYHSTMTEQNAARLSDLVAAVNGNTLTINSKKEGVAGLFLVTAGGVANSAEYMVSTSAGSVLYTVNNTAAGTISACCYQGFKLEQEHLVSTRVFNNKALLEGISFKDENLSDNTFDGAVPVDNAVYIDFEY